VSLSLSRRDLSHWSTETKGWVCGRGEFVAHLGFSSRDLPERVEFRFGTPVKEG